MPAMQLSLLHSLQFMQLVNIVTAKQFAVASGQLLPLVYTVCSQPARAGTSASVTFCNAQHCLLLACCQPALPDVYGP